MYLALSCPVLAFLFFLLTGCVILSVSVIKTDLDWLRRMQHSLTLFLLLLYQCMGALSPSTVPHQCCLGFNVMPEGLLLFFKPFSVVALVQSCSAGLILCWHSFWWKR